MATITILGLGPGDAGLLTRQAWELLERTPLLYLRTAIHPTVAALPPQIELRSFDARYEQAGAFGDVYAQIVGELIERAAGGESLVYAVPGHPLVAEATTRNLLTQARARGIDTRIVGGLSFIEPVCAALGRDPLEHGMQLIDALDMVPLGDDRHLTTDDSSGSSDSWASLHDYDYDAPLLPFPLLPTRPALICQIYNRRVASEVKISLMERYPASHPITLVRAAGVDGDEQVWTVPLHEIDHQDALDHLSCAFVPALDPLADRRSPEGIGYVVARLLGPGGCPWDREQTHQSLRPELLEETYEVLEALDADDSDALAEELGDVLLSVLMHSEIARQAGEFDINDVYEQIASKLIRRHPHVFGDVTVNGSGEVLVNWDAIKQAEREAGGKAPRGLFDGIPPGLPALMAAQETVRKAAKAGFDSDDPYWAWEKLHEELNEVRAAATTEPYPDDAARAERVAEEFGDLLLAIARLSMRLKLDAESALRAAIAKFRRRFAAMQRVLAEQGRDFTALSVPEKEALWAQAKDESAAE